MICVNRTAFQQLVDAYGEDGPQPGSSSPVLCAPDPLRFTPKTITVAGILSAKHYFDAQEAMHHRYWFKTYLPIVVSGVAGVVLVVSGLAFVLLAEQRSIFGFLLLGFLVSLPAQWRLRRLALIRERPFDEGNFVPRGTVLNEHGVEFRTPATASVCTWQAFTGYWISTKTLVLGAGARWFPIPREHCQSEGDWQRLLSLVQTHLSQLPSTRKQR